jgi:heme-degrading monooxygenase HmoA
MIPVVIARIWRGVTLREKADEYERYVAQTGIGAYRATPGNRGAWILRRDVGERTEFLTLSMWDSWDAIRRFAGDDPQRAVFYPRDDEFLIDRDLEVVHYEVAEDESSEAG